MCAVISPNWWKNIFPWSLLKADWTPVKVSNHSRLWNPDARCFCSLDSWELLLWRRSDAGRSTSLLSISLLGPIQRGGKGFYCPLPDSCLISSLLYHCEMKWRAKWWGSFLTETAFYGFIFLLHRLLFLPPIVSSYSPPRLSLLCILSLQWQLL